MVAIRTAPSQREEKKTWKESYSLNRWGKVIVGLNKWKGWVTLKTRRTTDPPTKLGSVISIDIDGKALRLYNFSWLSCLLTGWVTYWLIVPGGLQCLAPIEVMHHLALSGIGVLWCGKVAEKIVFQGVFTNHKQVLPTLLNATQRYARKLFLKTSKILLQSLLPSPQLLLLDNKKWEKLKGISVWVGKSGTGEWKKLSWEESETLSLL